MTASARVSSLIASLALASTAISAAPLTGNDAAPPETVVVTGERLPAQSLDEIVRDYVDAHGKFSPKIKQLTRWTTAICPEVRNMPPAFGDFIVKRLKAIAASVNAPVKEPCKVNVEIIFTSEPQLLLDKIVEKDPRLLGYHFIRNAQRDAKVTRPIQAWYVTSTSNGVATFLDEAYHGTPLMTLGSRLSPNVYSTFNHVLIVADTDKLGGYPIGPVADYISMLALSQAKAPANCGQLSSILDYLSDGCPNRPESLTIADKSYLEALYFMEKEEIGQLQKSAISQHVEKSVGEK